MLTLKAAANEKYSLDFIRSEVKSGRLAGYKIGGRFFTTAGDLQEYENKMKPAKWQDIQRHGPGIYVIGFGVYVKIGWSDFITTRISDLQLGVPEPLRLHGIIADERRMEVVLHRRFSAYRLRGEWFRHEGELRNWVSDLARQEVRLDPRMTA